MLVRHLFCVVKTTQLLKFRNLWYKIHLIKTPLIAFFVLQMATHVSHCLVHMEDFAKTELVATTATASLGTRASTVKLVQNCSLCRQLGSSSGSFSKTLNFLSLFFPHDLIVFQRYMIWYCYPAQNC